jgi:hypothetical protein
MAAAGAAALSDKETPKGESEVGGEESSTSSEPGEPDSLVGVWELYI